jgi:myosin heavy subunit
MNQELVFPHFVFTCKTANGFSATGDHSNFVIRHYAGDVSYSADHFIDKNRNYLSPDLVPIR